MIAISAIHPVILNLCKKEKDLDNEECYLGLADKSAHSEYVLFLYLMFQLSIPMTIPLLNPYMSIAVIVIFLLCNIALLIKHKTTRFRICRYYRLISKISFILFNVMLVVYKVLLEYCPDIPHFGWTMIGWASTGFLAIVIIMEIIEIFTEIGIRGVEIVKGLIKGMKKTEQPIEIENSNQ